MNPDVTASGVDVIRHYFDRGWREGRDPHPLFDVSWYLGQHPEVDASGFEPLQHYVDWGWRESWAPHRLFDGKWYSIEYGTNREPLSEYVERGLPAGRFVHPEHRRSVVGLGTSVERRNRAIRWSTVTTQDGVAATRSPLGILPWVEADEVGIDMDLLFPPIDDLTELRRSRIIGRTGSSQPRNLDDPVGVEPTAQEVDLDLLSVPLQRARVGKTTRILLPLERHQEAVSRLTDLGIPAHVIDLAERDQTRSDTPGAVSLRTGSAEMRVVPDVLPRSHGVAALRSSLDDWSRAAVGAVPRVKVMEARAVMAAYASALLPTALVASAIETAEAEGLQTVHYMSREGAFLARVHQVVAPILKVGEQAPRAVHLALSRRSTFGPSLRSFSSEALMDLWRMYGSQSLRALIVSLGDDVSRYRRLAHTHGLDIDETVHRIHDDPRVSSFLADEAVQAMLSRTNQDRFQALDAYLAETWDRDAGKLVVVDVGWRGTIQDNLARAYPDLFIIGCYLALFPFLNPQPANVTKSAVGPDGNSGDDFAFMEPPAAVERPWTPDVPSVVDYRQDPNGRSVPVEEREFLGHAERRLIDAFQSAALDAVRIVAAWIASEGLVTEDLRPLILAEVSDYYRRPLPGCADIWFSSAHDDTFGALNVTPFGKSLPTVEWLEAGLGYGFRQHLERAAADSMWSAGYRAWLPVQSLISLERALRTGSFE